MSDDNPLADVGVTPHESMPQQPSGAQESDNPLADVKADQEQAPTQQHGMYETAARHGLHGVTGGFSDELAGLLQVGHGVPFLGLARLGYEKLTGGEDVHKEYRQARDEYRKRLEESAQQHPIVAGGADIAGSMVMPGGAYLKGASKAERLIRGAYVGAGQGAIRGAGEAKEMENVPHDVATGGLWGAGLGAGFNAVLGQTGRAASAAAKDLIDTANKYGVQLPRYMVSENPVMQFFGKTGENLPIVGSRLAAAKETAEKGVNAIRQDMIEQALGFGATPTEARDIASKAAIFAKDQFDKSRKAISEADFTAIGQALNHPGLHAQPANLAKAVAEQTTRLAEYGASPGPVLQRAANAVHLPPGLTYQAMKDLRSSLYKVWKEGASDTDKASLTQLTQAITKDMEDHILTAGGPQAVRMWQNANVQHGFMKDISKELGTAVGTGTSDTAAADAIFRHISSDRPNIGAVNTLRGVMSTQRPDEWAKIQASVLSRMGADETGRFSIEKFLTANSKLPEAGKTAMFGPPGSAKRDGYDAIVKIGSAMQKLDRFTNYSKSATTGASLAALVEFFHHPVQATKDIIGGTLMAGFLASPATARKAGIFATAFDKFASGTGYAVGKVPRSLEVAARNLAISLANGGQ